MAWKPFLYQGSACASKFANFYNPIKNYVSIIFIYRKSRISHEHQTIKKPTPIYN